MINVTHDGHRRRTRDLLATLIACLCQAFFNRVVFDDARITTYVPIFVRRRTLAQLRTGSSEFTEKLA